MRLFNWLRRWWRADLECSQELRRSTRDAMDALTQRQDRTAAATVLTARLRELDEAMRHHG